MWSHRRPPTRLPEPWDSPGKNTGVECRFLLQYWPGSWCLFREYFMNWVFLRPENLWGLLEQAQSGFAAAQSSGICTKINLFSWKSNKVSLVYRTLCVCAGHTVMSDSVTPSTVALQAPLTMGFSRQEYWRDCHSLLQGSSRPGDQIQVSCLAGSFLTLWPEILGIECNDVSISFNFFKRGP